MLITSPSSATRNQVIWTLFNAENRLMLYAQVTGSYDWRCPNCNHWNRHKINPLKFTFKCRNSRCEYTHVFGVTHWHRDAHKSAYRSQPSPRSYWYSRSVLVTYSWQGKLTAPKSHCRYYEGGSAARSSANAKAE